MLFGPSAELLNDPRYAAPALFALQYALAGLEQLGNRADYVIGHDAGEIAAGCAAGMLDLETAVRLVLGHDAPVQVSPARMPVVSSVTGEVLGGEGVPEYWRQQRQPPSSFRKGIGTIIQAGCTLLIEMGPHPALSADIAAALDLSKTRLVPTLERAGSRRKPSGNSGASHAPWGAGPAGSIVRDVVDASACHFRCIRSGRNATGYAASCRRKDGRAAPGAAESCQRWLAARRRKERSRRPEELGNEVPETPLHDVEWQPRELGSGTRWTEAAAGHSDRSQRCRTRVAARLEASGEACVVTPPAELSRTSFGSCCRTASGNGAGSHPSWV